MLPVAGGRPFGKIGAHHPQPEGKAHRECRNSTEIAKRNWQRKRKQARRTADIGFYNRVIIMDCEVAAQPDPLPCDPRE
jgi:hypothetical protein